MFSLLHLYKCFGWRRGGSRFLAIEKRHRFLKSLFIIFFSDDDMQSIASLMSIGSSKDIGNLEDMEDEDEDADTASIRTETTNAISDLASMCEELERSHDNMSPINNSSSKSAIRSSLFIISRYFSKGCHIRTNFYSNNYIFRFPHSKYFA